MLISASVGLCPVPQGRFCGKTRLVIGRTEQKLELSRARRDVVAALRYTQQIGAYKVYATRGINRYGRSHLGSSATSHGSLRREGRSASYSSPSRTITADTQSSTGKSSAAVASTSTTARISSSSATTINLSRSGTVHSSSTRYSRNGCGSDYATSTPTPRSGLSCATNCISCRASRLSNAPTVCSSNSSSTALRCLSAALSATSIISSSTDGNTATHSHSTTFGDPDNGTPSSSPTTIYSTNRRKITCRSAVGKAVGFAD